MFVVLVGLALAIGALTMIASLQALRRDAFEASWRDLAIGQRVFGRLLDTREEQLARGVRVLANDFGFREAVATGDVTTLRSVLANHGRRIEADLVAFIQREGRITAATHRLAASNHISSNPAVAAMLDESPERATIARTIMLPDGAFQLVVTPVYAPQLIGWVSVGFSVDDALAGELRDLTSLEVTFITSSRDGESGIVSSTLPPDDQAELTPPGTHVERLASTPDVVDLADAYFSLGFELTSGVESVFVLLQRPLSEALANYHRLVEQLIAIFVGTVLLSILAAAMIAKGVTRPVSRLAEAAKRIADGRYDEPVTIDRTDEIGLLGTAFNEMQAGISERERRIIYQSRHDVLTDLPNRLALQEYTSALLQRIQADSGQGMLFLIDIRQFKAINDTFGHETGDDVLRELARRLRDVVQESDLVARYGSNSFVIVSEVQGERQAKQLVERIFRYVREPLALPQAHVGVQLTIGLVGFPEHGMDFETLIRRAEMAMYRARQRGAKQGIYESGQDEDHLRRLDVTQQLATALEHDMLEVSYQPKLDLRGGTVEEAEALVRWRHDRLGLIPPSEFVPIAEQSGLMSSLTDNVLRHVARQIHIWSAQGICLKVAVNISTIDLSDEGFADRVYDVISEFGLAPHSLKLEITESVLMSEPEKATAVLQALRGYGFALSIDDFGTGYSSLVQLKRMPVSELKIDKSFILGLPENEGDKTIVRSTIELGHNLGLDVVAEGVETDRCMNYLIEQGCDIAQGFGVCRPQPVEAFTKWIQERQAAPQSKLHASAGERGR